MIYLVLTPTDERDNNEVSDVDICGDDGLLEDEQGLGSHPHETHQSEVVDQSGDDHTHFKQLNTLNANNKAEQHQNH